MNLADALRTARDRIEADTALGKVFFAIDAIPAEFKSQAVDLLEEASLPIAAGARMAIEKFERTKSDADAIEAVRISSLNTHQLFEWLDEKGRESWTVRAGFNKAILKASNAARTKEQR